MTSIMLFNRGLLSIEFGNMFSPLKSRVHIGARPGWVKQRQSGGAALRCAAPRVKTYPDRRDRSVFTRPVKTLSHPACLPKPHLLQ